MLIGGLAAQPVIGPQPYGTYPAEGSRIFMLRTPDIQNTNGILEISGRVEIDLGGDLKEAATLPETLYYWAFIEANYGEEKQISEHFTGTWEKKNSPPFLSFSCRGSQAVGQFNDPVLCRFWFCLDPDPNKASGHSARMGNLHSNLFWYHLAWKDHWGYLDTLYIPEPVVITQ
jgi:hypothetical protein